MLQWKFGVGNILGAVKATAPSITEKVRKLPKIVSRGSEVTELTHVETSQRHGKRYRNERSVFTLSDSDTEAESVPVALSPSASDPKVDVFLLRQLKSRCVGTMAVELLNAV